MIHLEKQAQHGISFACWAGTGTWKSKCWNRNFNMASSIVLPQDSNDGPVIITGFPVFTSKSPLNKYLGIGMRDLPPSNHTNNVLQLIIGRRSPRRQSFHNVISVFTMPPILKFPPPLGLSRHLNTFVSGLARNVSRNDKMGWRIRTEACMDEFHGP